MRCSVKFSNGKMVWIQSKTSSPEQLRDAESFLSAAGRKERALLGTFVLIAERGEVLTAERLLSSAFGLMSSLCLDKLDWESFPSRSARENTTRDAEPFLHFNEKQKELQSSLPFSSHPIASDTAALRRDAFASSHRPRPHANPTVLLWGIQIAAASGAAGGAARVRSSRCVITAT